jgi:general nucleoside transport system permease protein
MTGHAAIIGSALLFVLTSGLRTGAPLVLASVGGCFSAQVKVFNIALEGMMLAGAFAGFAASDASGCVVVGLFAGIGAGLLVALLVAVSCVDFKADEIVVGFAVNLASLALTAVLLRSFYGSQGSYLSERAGLVQSISAGPLRDVPVVSAILQSLDGVILATIAIAVAAHAFAYRTRNGLRMRAIGDGPEIAASAGVNVRHYRYQALLIGGALCGLGGAYLPLSGLSLFSVGMTAGQGFIAVAAVIFANGEPLVAAAVAFAFGLTTALGIELEQVQIPSELVQALPYCATVLGLLLHAKRREAARERHAASEGLSPSSSVAAAEINRGEVTRCLVQTRPDSK